MKRSAAITAICCCCAASASAQSLPDTTRAIRLPDLVITASGFSQARTVAPASITVLPRHQLLAQRTTSLAEMLSGVEGVDAGGTVGKTGGLNVSLRGMPSEYTLVLVDGRRQNTAGSVTPNGFGETSSSFLPALNSIERVEVIRGPMSTLYGSDAMGGVINIITRKQAVRWGGSLTSGATLQQESQFGNQYSGDGQLSGPLVPGLLSLSVRGALTHRAESRLRATGDAEAGTLVSRRGPSPVQSDVRSGGARLTLTRGSHELWLDVDGARQSYDNSEGQLGTLDRPDGSPATFNGYGPELQFNRDQAALAHSWRFAGGNGLLNSSIMRNFTETIGRTIPPGTPGGMPGSGAPPKVAGSARALETTSIVLDSKATLSHAAHTITVGGQYWDSEMVDGVALSPFESMQWALFAEDEWRVADRTSLTLGLRRDDHSAFGAQVSPRVYLVFEATPSLTLKGGVSRGYRTPRVEQLVDGVIGFTGQGRTAMIGTPSLRPETSTSTELSAAWRSMRGATAAVTVFDNRFDDKIARGTPVPNCTFAGAPDRDGCENHGSFPTQEFFAQSVNIDEARTRGAELMARLPLSQRVTLQGSYTHTRSEQLSGENAGMPLTNTPAHMFNGELKGELSERANAWLRGEYRSERARRLSSSEDAAWEQLGDYRPYGLMHVGAGYTIGRGVTVNATVYNLLNRDFLKYGAYTDTPTSANPDGVFYTNLYNNHQEGRRLWLSTTVQF